MTPRMKVVIALEDGRTKETVIEASADGGFRCTVPAGAVSAEFGPYIASKLNEPQQSSRRDADATP